ncbi:MAG: hypothetical protein AAFN78_16740 [Pseudomonadota bacterium]
MMSFRSSLAWALSLASLLFAPLTHAHSFHHHAEEHTSHEAPLPERLAEAQALLAGYQKSGDESAVARAAALVGDAADAPDADTLTLTTAAAVAQATHRFDQALDLLDRAISRAPRDTQARLLRAAVRRVRGDLAGSAEDCRAIGHHGLELRIGCLGAAAQTGDDKRRAYDALIAVLDAGVAKTPTAQWLHSVAGDLATSLGYEAEAIAQYEAALSKGENGQVRAALVDRLLDAGRFEDALDTAGEGGEQLALAVRRYIAAERLGQLSRVKAEVDLTRHQFEDLAAAGDYEHAREMARFYLDVDFNLALAARFARLNFADQREAEDLALMQRTGQLAN